ncbi:aminotransferase class V-fold PLP-dependent enzyme [Dokdonia ponticola]|uniref:Aminotransferase class V-fold PLP-dependent enzyme n=1 Tax=Dokdonia ponticola TaxID=2041041 RepID=A0ABV9HRY9_9FLAO
MKHNRRRSFIKQALAGITGATLLPSFTATASTTKETTPALDPTDTSEAFWETVKKQFVFADGLHYFNNASLGSSPISVQKATNEFRATLDSFPSKYMWGDWSDEKEAVRQKVADLFSVSNEEIAITHNTTEGMNLIARSFDLQPGDEVILGDHEHSSGTVPWKIWQESKGVRLVRPVLPILPETIEDIVAVYRNAITSKTKVISICHMVNTNGMILPIKEISEMAHQRGILVAVDGAQSSGMFAIDLHDLGCDFYTASAHKWLFSPKGISVFYAKKESQHYLKPLMVARGYDDPSIRRLENYNTRNLPEYLGLGAAVDFHMQIGKEKIAQRSFELKNYFRSKVQNNPSFKLKTPENDALSCAIQTVEIVGKDVREVKKQLFENYGIDTRPMTTFGLNGVRISFAIFITKKDIDYLVEALEEIANS